MKSTFRVSIQNEAGNISIVFNLLKPFKTAHALVNKFDIYKYTLNHQQIITKKTILRNTPTTFVFLDYEILQCDQTLVSKITGSTRSSLII